MRTNGPLYLCDPSRYQKCTKEGCYEKGFPCSNCTHPDFAFCDSKGEPVTDWDFTRQLRKTIDNPDE